MIEAAGVADLLDQEVERWRALADPHRLSRLTPSPARDEDEALVYMSVALTLAALANVLRDAT